MKHTQARPLFADTHRVFGNEQDLSSGSGFRGVRTFVVDVVIVVGLSVRVADVDAVWQTTVKVGFFLLASYIYLLGTPQVRQEDKVSGKKIKCSASSPSPSLFGDNSSADGRAASQLGIRR